MKILDARSSFSSLRANMLLATIASLSIPLGLTFYLIWSTIHNTMDWLGWSGGMTAYAAFLYQLWYGKERNKKVEVGAGEISEKTGQG